MSSDRNWRKQTSRFEDPNLVPFMNMVVVLIPMLLLSVVFLKVGVINVSSPRMAPTDADTTTETSEEFTLTVATSLSGFEVSTQSGPLEPIEGCPKEGATVCLADSTFDVDGHMGHVERALARGDQEQVEKLLDELVAAYDFAGLYSKLRSLKAEHPDATSIRLTASPKIPYEMLVQVMDAVRFQLDNERYASTEAFWRDLTRAKKAQPEEMFSQPILAVAK